MNTVRDEVVLKLSTFNRVSMIFMAMVFLFADKHTFIFHLSSFLAIPQVMLIVILEVIVSLDAKVVSGVIEQSSKFRKESILTWSLWIGLTIFFMSVVLYADLYTLWNS
jgi:hypothetical protein